MQNHTPLASSPSNLHYCTFFEEHMARLVGGSDSEKRKALISAIGTFKSTALDECRAYMKKHKSTHILNLWHTNLSKIANATNNLQYTVSELVIQATNIGNEVFNHPLLQNRTKIKLQEVAAQQESLSTLDKVLSYTYLLQAGSTTTILFDEQKMSNSTTRLYTRLPYTHAHLTLANLPYFNYNPMTDKETRSNVLDAWRESPERVTLTGITFDPSTTDRIVNNEFNTWQGWAYEPVKSDADLPFWDLVQNVICDGNDEYYTFVRKFLAHMVQKPNERPLCALGISGPQRAGKSVFAKVVGSLMHKSHYNENVTMEDLTNLKQSRALEGKLLAYVDEATWGGDKANTGAMKKAITGEYDVINEKFVPSYSVPSYKRIIFTSNEDYYYNADADDRRLLPLEIDRSKPLKSYEFFQSIVEGSGGLRDEVQSAVLYTLQNEDIAGFIPHKALKDINIKTGAVMLEKSMSNVQRWLKHSINNRDFELDSDNIININHEPNRILVKHLKDSYEYYCSQSSFDKNRMQNLSAKENLQLIRQVFGHPAKVFKIQGTTHKGYHIDWHHMKENFCSMFKWSSALEWDEYEDDNNILTMFK